MKIEIKIPTMGESVAEARISNILKPSGSFVKQEEEIIKLETDKVNQVLYAPQNGTLSWTVQLEDTVTIGQVIGSIETTGAAPSAPTISSPPPEEKKSPPPTPAVATSPPPQVAGNVTRKKMSNLRKVIAQRLVEVKNTTAMLTTFNEVDMSNVLAIRSKEKDRFLAKYGVKLGLMSFFIKATVAALKEIPDINAYIDREEIVQVHSYAIGVAVSTEKGLIVPVIRDCENLSFGQIELELDRLARKGREGSISIGDLQGGSFTITNGGVFGSLLSTPILNPPQSGILGMHAIVKRPVAIDDQVVIRPMMYTALSYDHRIVDGKEAVMFLVHLKQNLEDPSRILLDI